MFCFSVNSKIREYFPDDACEFVAVTAETSGYGDSGFFRMVSNYEVLVGAIGIKTGAGF